MARRVAISQSNYVPWKGYFDTIASVDEFVFLEDVQFTKRDWRSRNRIKTPSGLQWLTVPVAVKGRYHQTIEDTQIADPAWTDRHLSTIQQSYASAARRRDHEDAIADMYHDIAGEPSLSAVNRRLVARLCALLEIAPPTRVSSEFQTGDSASERLLDICLACEATEYVSGPAAQAYLDIALFEKHGIEVSWMEYEGYPEYPQPHGPFEHHVSILDLLLCTGRDAPAFVGHQRGQRA